MKRFKRLFYFALAIFMAGNVFGNTVDFHLNSNGISHICWPFPDSDWDNRNGWRMSGNGHGQNTHHGGDYYAEDWNKGAGNDDCEENFYAPISGVIIYAGGNNNTDGYGFQVIIQSDVDNDFAFRIAHLFEGSIAVNVGDHVNVGDFLAKIGNTGASVTCHAHIVLYKNINDKYPEDDSPQTALWRLKRGYSLNVHGDANKWAAEFMLDGVSVVYQCKVLYEDHFRRNYQPWWYMRRGSWSISGNWLYQSDRRTTGRAQTPYTDLSDYNDFQVMSRMQMTYSYRGRGEMYLEFPGGYLRFEDRRSRITIRTNRSYRFDYPVYVGAQYNVIIEGNSDQLKVTINGSVFIVPNSGMHNDIFGYTTKKCKAKFDDFIVTGTEGQLPMRTPIIIDIVSDSDTVDTKNLLFTDANISDDNQNITNSPNPFSTETNISFKADFSGKCSVKIFDILGKLVKAFDRDVQTGELCSFIWNISESESNIDPGVYVSIITIDGQLIGRDKMIVTK